MEYAQTALIIAVGIMVLITNRKREQKTGTGSGAVVVDSCGAIDGRIVELANAGFIPASIIVPQFVIAELQQLADGHDSQKRERARFGLDVIKLLQENANLSVDIAKETYADGDVDDMLVALAKKRGANLYTTDFNLNKVAAIHSVRVLNVNELAQMIRPVALPGENITVKIVQKGSGQGQGVGYMEDGTMVVVDKAANRIGKNVSVQVTRTLQTAAGKMLFATAAQKLDQNRRK